MAGKNKTFFGLEREEERGRGGQRDSVHCFKKWLGAMFIISMAIST